MIPRPSFTGTTVPINRCWRCVIKAVDHRDELGLCDDCKGVLRDPEFIAPVYKVYKTDEGRELDPG